MRNASPRLVGAHARRLVAVLMCVSGAVWGGGCQSAPKEVKKVAAVPLRDVPDVFRGTIGAEGSINGTEPQLVSGLGIVVNLNGTGGGEIRPDVLATMERELSRNGVGRGSNAVGVLEGMSPQEFLRSPNVAVVVVEAKIAPGAPEDSEFDVAVRTLPGSTVTSLEGGTLWTTDLRLGPATTFGGYKTRKLAEARGPIYVNPFTEPAAGGPSEAVITRTSGRVLGGGRVTEPLKLELVLDTDSHSRARSVVAAINASFPREPGEMGQTARGRGTDSMASGTPGEAIVAQTVAISIPRAYKDDPAEFLDLLRYTRIDQAFPQDFAKRYVEELKANPSMSRQLCGCLKAIGKTAVPFLNSMYDYPEFAPRMAALEAGAFHNDARVAPHLIELAKSAPASVRLQAIRLMAKLPRNPNVGIALFDLLNAPELEVRVGAYEAVSKRFDGVIPKVAVGINPRQPKFVLESVPSSAPMVYVTQQGAPKIVIFGGGWGGSEAARNPRERSAGVVMLQKPSTVTAWSDRFMLRSDCETCPVRMMYRNARTGETTQQNVSDKLVEFIEYLAHKPTPEEPAPGLDMSYSEVVGLLYELSRQEAIAATFATEQDRLRAEIFEASQATALNDRPEDSEATDEKATVFKPTAPIPLRPVDGEPAVREFEKPKIVPLAKPAAKPKTSTTTTGQ